MSEAKVVLVAKTEDARHALGGSEIVVDVFPFRIGRESRFGVVEGQWKSLERRNTDVRASNDLYLIDRSIYLQISRQHCQIEKQDDETFAVRDRGSTCGTAVGSTRLDAEDGETRCPLRTGDMIQLGTEDSPFRYEFEVRQE